MPDHENLSLIPLPGSALVKQSPGAGRVLSAMVGEALVLVRQHQATLQVEMFRIGEHELCGPDYRQILQWAASMELEPIVFLERLLMEKVPDKDGPVNWSGTRIEDGRLMAIHWNTDVLEISLFHLSEPLQLESLSFGGGTRRRLLASLDLSKAPGLKRLDCSYTSITELNLSSVQSLTALHCVRAKIKELDLSQVPGLISLNCSNTKITKLGAAGIAGE